MTKIDTNPPGVDLAKLRQVSNGSTHFHGSRSGSLITFHSSTPADRRGALLPMGALRQANAPVFSGERGNSLDAKAFNNAHLSVVDEKHINSAIDYATNQRLARKSPVASTQASEGQPEAVPTPLAARAQQALRNLADDPKMQSMVEQNFPVVYGLRPREGDLVGVSSSIPGEVGVAGGVKASQIATIFVPDEHVPSVRGMMASGGLSIPVQPMSAYQR